MNENIKVYAELIESANQCSKLLIQSQLSIENGDLALSQKQFLQVKDILNTLVNDTFNEIKELCHTPVVESDDYDISSLYLASLLNDSCHLAGVLISLENEEQTHSIKEAILTKLIKSLNACTELFFTLFN